ncbi:hypothetical protein F5Y14DRAFT_447655 [Nemania sp. NC0429]|nr:hypothetical protein F5Y14DRAFT_447655 [Nemania sp. NC0429]
MANISALGEAHTPVHELDCVSILIYQTDRRGKQPLVLVRSHPCASEPVHSSPGQKPIGDETAVDCARRAAWGSLRADIPGSQLDYRMSAVIENYGEHVKIRVFIVEISPEIAPAIDYVTLRPETRGWKYEFLPPSDLECVYLHEHIGVTRVALRELLKTS